MEKSNFLLSVILVLIAQIPLLLKLYLEYKSKKDVFRQDIHKRHMDAYEEIAAAMNKVDGFGRVIAPMSENATVDWVKRTALCDIPGNEGVAVKRDGLYRVTDKLLERKEKIEEFLREKEQGLFRLEQKIGRIKERYRRVAR